MVLIRPKMRTVLSYPAFRPDPMFVCLCHGVTDKQIRQAAEDGVREVHELTMRTGAGASCGSCLELAAQLLDEHHARPLPLPVLRAA